MAKSNEKISQNQPESRRGKSRYADQARPARIVLPERPPRAVDHEIVAILLGGDPAQLAAQEDGGASSLSAHSSSLPDVAAEPAAQPPFIPETERAPVIPAPVITRKPTQAAPQQRRAVATAKMRVEAAPERTTALPAPEAAIVTFAEFVERWKHGLRKGQFAVCEVLYQKTHALGVAECVTSFAELARLSGLQMRQCFNIIAQLEALGFIERSRTPEGANKKDQGSTIRFHLFPKH